MAPRNRKKQKTEGSTSTSTTTNTPNPNPHPPLDIPEDEQWRLIQESGVLDGLKRPSEVRAEAEATGQPPPRAPKEPLVKGVPKGPGASTSRGTPLVKEIKPGEEITLEHLTSPGAASLAAEDTTPDHNEPTPDPNEPTPFAEEIFQTASLLIPFTFCLVLMDVLIHQQYGQEARLWDILDRLVSAVPILAVFIFYTTRHKNTRPAQAALFALSLFAGPRLLWVLAHKGYLVNIQQSPPLATAWIYTITQLDLGPAVVSLMITGAWARWKGLGVRLFRDRRYR
ncbi:uncharacterized protein SCHCODRAFT_02622724 [Schizophyllum commune H4-8]|uniref:uncharacterized protein n=1 Tax=Schizophyllum commune (strain H4-8 / FGSC 9210) TaxID=578458 RepID=UPI00215E7D4E|nr:uncharacterized protein SCHCODRAFT_02622724 [Schizophyllum commune H4-8]KAI5893772.1 hypothetical protein SCHCODRAFT_02622724 [Schizophyllum commune H4-8]